MSRKNLLKVSYTKEEIAQFRKDLRAYKDAMKSGTWKQKPYNEFLTIVKNRLEPDLTSKDVKCPFCNAKQHGCFSGSQTLVGSLTGYDRNHHWDWYKCPGCQKEFTVEYKGVEHAKNKYNVWYTAKTDNGDKILKGLPTCFERYIYTCNKCDGEVIRTYYNKGTRDKASYIVHTVDGMQCDIVFACQNCKNEVLSTTEYYLENSPHKPRKPHKKIRWRIIEEMGIVAINDYSVSKININEES